MARSVTSGSGLLLWGRCPGGGRSSPSACAISFGTDYKIAQHGADVADFIEAIGEGGPVDLMSHSRGGHISFRVVQQRPASLRRLVLAEPVGKCVAAAARRA